MKQEHIDFLEKNKINFETVKLGYTKNIPMQDLQMYEHIYHLYLNPSYVLTYWCGDCVFDMLKRLMNYYENLPQERIATEAETIEVIKAFAALPVIEDKPKAKPKARKK